jgi:hypothetical protein
VGREGYDRWTEDRSSQEEEFPGTRGCRWTIDRYGRVQRVMATTGRDCSCTSWAKVIGVKPSKGMYLYSAMHFNWSQRYLSRPCPALLAHSVFFLYAIQLPHLSQGLNICCASLVCPGNSQTRHTFGYIHRANKRNLSSTHPIPIPQT